MSLPDKVAALFEVVVFWAIFVADKTTAVDRDEWERPGALGNYLQLVAKDKRWFSCDA